jgi:hypothetical protein
MWRKILLGLLYRVVLAMPEVLLKDKNLSRRSKAKDLLFKEPINVPTVREGDSTK